MDEGTEGRAPAPDEPSGDEPLAPTRRRARPRRGLWQVVAAAAVLGIGLYVLRALTPSRGDAELGRSAGGDSAIAPVGAVADFELFRWRLDLSLGGHYVVTVVPIGPAGEALGEVRSPRLTSSRWNPPADERARWTRIRWSVASFRRGEREALRSTAPAEAWLGR